MSTKPENSKKNTDKRSILVVPSKLVRTASETFDGIEATEITAEISIPTEGGWGWVVVMASFTCAFILDGAFFTFGSIYQDMVADIEKEETLVALINSVAVSLYLVSGPLASALINRFGFRAVTMSGSIIVSFSFLCSYFATSYLALLTFYGIVSGFGGCLILVPSIVVVGFYFERLRAIAIALAGTGSSLGIMVMFTVNSMIVQLAGWRIITLIHAGLFGITFFLAMAYRPLLSMTVTTTTETNDPTRTITYLPSLVQTGATISKAKAEGITSSPTERLFGAISNYNYPTAASVIQEGVMAQTPGTQAGPSSAAVSKLTLKAINPAGSISRKQLNQVQSMVSRAQIQSANKEMLNVEIAISEAEETQKESCWKKLCRWEKHVAQSRPMYRDDAFYNGKIQNLPIYHKSVIDVDPEARTGLEYQLAVSRAVTVAELEEKEGLCTTATKRILATMLDPQLLKRCSFLLICWSAVLMYVGLLIPYVFLADRNKSEGIEEFHCNLFVSVIGFCNAIGRLSAGVLASKFNPIYVYLVSCIISGFGTMAYNFSFNVYYQYFCCVVFGIFIAGVTGVRSILLVHCYGLEKLTNATGMILMAQGFGSLISTPLSSYLKEIYGYSISFNLAGIVLVLSGLVLIPVSNLINKENERLETSTPAEQIKLQKSK